LKTTMRAIWHSLAWKEWHEHKRLALALLVSECGALLPAWFQQSPYFFASFFITLMIVAAPAAVFVGMTTAPSERPQQTLPFLSSLPISRRKLAGVKLVAGLVTCLLPLLLSLLTLWCWYWCGGQYLPGVDEAMRFSLNDLHGFVNSANWFVVAALMAASVTISLFLWTVATGANRPDEVSAGAWALAAMAGIWTTAFCVSWVVDRLTLGALTKDHAWLVSAVAAAPAMWIHNDASARLWPGHRLPDRRRIRRLPRDAGCFVRSAIWQRGDK
jgi:hypothetical protein